MAKKKAKIAGRGIGMMGKKDQGPVYRYAVVDKSGYPIYGFASETEEGLRYRGEGTDLADAVRLAKGLVTPGGVALLGPDNILYGGKVEGEDTFEPKFMPVETIDWSSEDEEGVEREDPPYS